MKKSLFGLVLLFIIFTTYKPNFDIDLNSPLNIRNIEIEIKNNNLIKLDHIRSELQFIYSKNLFFIDLQQIENTLKKDKLIQSIIIKKNYPFKIQIQILEKKPLAILQQKKNKYYILDDGNLVNFVFSEVYQNLPVVFGNGLEFYSFYKDLEYSDFPIDKIKSFYYFDSGRWDLLLRNGKTIKLPIKEYIFSLKNFINSINDSNFDKYKIFDYRIKDQLILN